MVEPLLQVTAQKKTTPAYMPVYLHIYNCSRNCTEEDVIALIFLPYVDVATASVFSGGKFAKLKTRASC